MASTPAQQQESLVQKLLLIEDPQERLAYLIERLRKTPGLPPEKRSESCRIQGCVTKVWLSSELRDGLCLFTVDSESPMVRGLASLIAEVYSLSKPEHAAAYESDVLQAARLERLVTPTRLHGLANLQAAIRAFAAAHSPAP